MAYLITRFRSSTLYVIYKYSIT